MWLLYSCRWFNHADHPNHSRPWCTYRLSVAAFSYTKRSSNLTRMKRIKAKEIIKFWCYHTSFPAADICRIHSCWMGGCGGSKHWYANHYTNWRKKQPASRVQTYLAWEQKAPSPLSLMSYCRTFMPWAINISIPQLEFKQLGDNTFYLNHPCVLSTWDAIGVQNLNEETSH